VPACGPVERTGKLIIEIVCVGFEFLRSPPATRGNVILHIDNRRTLSGSFVTRALQNAPPGSLVHYWVSPTHYEIGLTRYETSHNRSHSLWQC